MYPRMAVAFLAVISSAGIAQTLNASGFPELTPRATLIAILKALDAKIADPRSVTDVVLCPATRIKLSRIGDRRPVSWYVAFSMNSRTPGGGYTGQIMYGASFKAGRLPSIFQAQTDDEQGFNRLINNAIRKQMKDCPRVPNEQLAALLGASDRPTVDVSQ